MPEQTCDVCDREPSAVVASVPFVPFSAAYCGTCLELNAHPWDVLVAVTAAGPGLAHTNADWRYMVTCTLARLGRLRTEFEDDVAAARAVIEEEARHADRP